MLTTFPSSDFNISALFNDNHATVWCSATGYSDTDYYSKLIPTLLILSCSPGIEAVLKKGTFHMLLEFVEDPKMIKALGISGGISKLQYVCLLHSYFYFKYGYGGLMDLLNRCNEV